MPQRDTVRVFGNMGATVEVESYIIEAWSNIYASMNLFSAWAGISLSPALHQAIVQSMTRYFVWFSFWISVDDVLIKLKYVYIHMHQLPFNGKVRFSNMRHVWTQLNSYSML